MKNRMYFIFTSDYSGGVSYVAACSDLSTAANIARRKAQETGVKNSVVTDSAFCLTWSANITLNNVGLYLPACETTYNNK